MPKRIKAPRVRGAGRAWTAQSTGRDAFAVPPSRSPGERPGSAMALLRPCPPRPSDGSSLIALRHKAKSADRRILDHRIAEQLLAHGFDLRPCFVLAISFDFEVEVFADADGPHAGEPEAVQSVAHHETLGVVDDRFQCDDDFDREDHPVTVSLTSMPQIRRAAST